MATCQLGPRRVHAPLPRSGSQPGDLKTSAHRQTYGNRPQKGVGLPGGSLPGAALQGAASWRNILEPRATRTRCQQGPACGCPKESLEKLAPPPQDGTQDCGVTGSCPQQPCHAAARPRAVGPGVRGVYTQSLTPWHQLTPCRASLPRGRPREPRTPGPLLLPAVTGRQRQELELVSHPGTGGLHTPWIRHLLPQPTHPATGCQHASILQN